MKERNKDRKKERTNERNKDRKKERQTDRKKERKKEEINQQNLTLKIITQGYPTLNPEAAYLHH